jgi:TATA-binding protein-associated factor Taf7
LIESCFGFSLQAVKLQQFFGQSTKGTETERELGGRRRSRAAEEAEQKKKQKNQKKQKQKQKKKKAEAEAAEEADAEAEEAEEEEAEKKNKIKSQKSILADICNPTETSRNFGRGGTWGCIVPVCMLVRDFLSVPAGTERNMQH